MGREFEMRPVMTYELAMAAAADAANRAMRSGGREVWSQEDYNAGVREFDRLFPYRDEAQQADSFGKSNGARI